MIAHHHLGELLHLRIVQAIHRSLGNGDLFVTRFGGLFEEGTITVTQFSINGDG
jgi:hypothetical protein